MTDSAGSIVDAYVYEPHGRIMNRTGTVRNPFTFVGAFGVMDDGNGLYFMKHRLYDSTTGKFLQKDHLGLAAGANLYT